MLFLVIADRPMGMPMKRWVLPCRTRLDLFSAWIQLICFWTLLLDMVAMMIMEAAEALAEIARLETVEHRRRKKQKVGVEGARVLQKKPAEIAEVAEAEARPTRKLSAKKTEAQSLLAGPDRSKIQ